MLVWNVRVKSFWTHCAPPRPPPFTRALNYMPTQPRPIEVELRPELTTKVSCLLLGRSHIVSFFEILSRFYVRKWIKSSKELRLCQLFYWYSSQMQAKPSRKIELVNKAYLFWYWQRTKLQIVVKPSRLVFALDPKRIIFVRCCLCSENHLLRIPKNRLSIWSKGAFIN